MFSFGILTHNEGINYLQKLIEPILQFCSDEDEVIIVDDYSDEKSTVNYLESLKNNKRIQIFKHALNKDFAQQKNFLIGKCKREYIFLMDADEYLTVDDIQRINFYLTKNNADVFFIHRTNIIENTNEEVLKLFKHCKNKKINENTYQIAVDCYQERIIKNNKNIKFKNKVHEHLYNYKSSIKIPEYVASIKHIKTANRQLDQASFYDTIQK